MQPIVVQGKDATLLDLRLFLTLRHGPLPAAELARRLALRADRAPTLLDALAEEGLLERWGGRYANAAEVDGLLDQADPAAARPRRALLLAPLLFVAAVGLAALFGMPAPRRSQAGPVLPAEASAGARETPADPYNAYADPIFYFVGSPAQADLVNSGVYSGGIDNPSALIVAAGSVDEAVQAHDAPPGTATLDIISTPEEELTTRALIEQVNAIRKVRGERLLYVVDLRSLGGPPPP